MKYAAISGFIQGMWGEQQIGQESFEKVDTEITQVPAVRTPVNQHSPK